MDNSKNNAFTASFAKRLGLSALKASNEILNIGVKIFSHALSSEIANKKVPYEPTEYEIWCCKKIAGTDEYIPK